MNDDKRFHDRSSAVPAMVGFALGAVLGAGLALLLAPTTGEEMRSRLASTAKKLGLDVKDKLDQTADRVSELGSSTLSAIEAGREAFLNDGTRRDSRLGAPATSQLQSQTTRAPSAQV